MKMNYSNSFNCVFIRKGRDIYPKLSIYLSFNNLFNKIHVIQIVSTCDFHYQVIRYIKYYVGTQWNHSLKGQQLKDTLCCRTINYK